MSRTDESTALLPTGTIKAPDSVSTRGQGAPRPRRSRTQRWVWGVAGTLSLLVGWQLASIAIDTSAFPTATDVLSALPALVASASFWIAIGNTLSSALVGLLIGAVIAIPLGLMLASSRAADLSTTAIIEFLKPIPVVALLPLALLMFGTTFQMKVVLIVFGTVWPLLIQVIYGVRNVDPLALAAARTFHISRARRFLFVILPSAAPSIGTGLRIAGVGALLLGIVTELVGGAPGVGREIARAQSAARFDDLYAYILVIGTIGILLNGLLDLIEKRTISWGHGGRKR